MSDFLTQALFGEYQSNGITPYSVNVSTFMAGPRGEKGETGPQGPPGEKSIQTLEIDNGLLKISDGNSVKLPDSSEPIQVAGGTYTLLDVPVQGVYAKNPVTHPASIEWAEGSDPRDYPAMLVFVKVGSTFIGYANKAASVDATATPIPHAPAPQQPAPAPITPAPNNPVPPVQPAPNPPVQNPPVNNTPITLVAPTLTHKFNGENIVIEWAPVTGATGYEVSLNGAAPTAATSPHSEHVAPGEAGSVKVRAVAGNVKSDFATLDYTAPAKLRNWTPLEFKAANNKINVHDCGDYRLTWYTNDKVVTPAGVNSTFGIYAYPDVVNGEVVKTVNDAVESNYPEFSAIPAGPAKTKLSERTTILNGLRTMHPIIKNVGEAARVNWSGELPNPDHYKPIMSQYVGASVAVSGRYRIGVQMKDANTYQAVTNLPMAAPVKSGEQFPANVIGQRYYVDVKPNDKAVQFEHDDAAINVYVVRQDDSKELVASVITTPSAYYEPNNADFGCIWIDGYEFGNVTVQKG